MPSSSIIKDNWVDVEIADSSFDGRPDRAVELHSAAMQREADLANEFEKKPLKADTVKGHGRAFSEAGRRTEL